jgi:hypothetical protein
MRVFLVDGLSGRVLKRIGAANAEDLIGRGIAERRSESVIALKLDTPAVAAPTHDENRPGEWRPNRSGGFTNEQLVH